MRLLHTTELRFQEFWSSNVPRYAILSHRWGDDEVSLQEMQYLLLDKARRSSFLTPALLDAEAKAEGKGYGKVRDFCKYAAQAKYEWVWVDTICIDKTSSSELSEAINSMFDWYESAACCYAYLQDVSSAAQDPQDSESHFRASEWWLRGWTLQELLAPKDVEFLDHSWQKIGTKQELAPLIHSITGIDLQCLLRQRPIWRFSIATRIGWARNRKTSRVEDIAYSLLGLLDINMPLLYGEGNQAFSRLCMAFTDEAYDDTILAHNGTQLYPSKPSDFPVDERYERAYPATHYSGKSVYAIEIWKRGIHIRDAVFIDLEPGPACAWRRRYIQLACQDSTGEHPLVLVRHAVGDIWYKPPKAVLEGVPPDEQRQVKAKFAYANKGSAPSTPQTPRIEPSTHSETSLLSPQRVASKDDTRFDRRGSRSGGYPVSDNDVNTQRRPNTERYSPQMYSAEDREGASHRSRIDRESKRSLDIAKHEGLRSSQGSRRTDDHSGRRYPPVHLSIQRGSVYVRP